MFKKIFKMVFGLLMIGLLYSNITLAQVSTKTYKSEYPQVSIAPVGGVQFPIGNLNDRYGTSWNAGLEVSLQVNKEVAFFLKGGYYAMPIKDEVTFNPTDANYWEITAGPRYIFSSPNIKAKFFLEAGLGAYIFHEKEYTRMATEIVPGRSTTNFGVNAGPGVMIPLGKVADLVMKAKIHYTFESDNSHAFIAAIIGVNFKL